MTDEKNDQRIVIVNPREGPLDDAREESANKNMVQLVQDVGLTGMTYRRDSSKDYGKGRFAYQLNHNQRDMEVQMPGRSLESVRYLGEEDQNIWDFPRLHVDGGSWVWEFAVNVIRQTYKNPD